LQGTAEVNGYWDDMRERFATLPQDHPARATVDPDHIPEHSVKLCRTHLNRYVLPYSSYCNLFLELRIHGSNLDELARKDSISQEDMITICKIFSVRTYSHWGCLLGWVDHPETPQAVKGNVSHFYALSFGSWLHSILC
jgi:hypothetical protein